MTQKIIESDKSISDLLQTIDPKGIADESMRHTVEVLLNLIGITVPKRENCTLRLKRLQDNDFRTKINWLANTCIISN
jgi:DNA-directed RNA polymerase specialized sigma54-like protein